MDSEKVGPRTSWASATVTIVLIGVGVACGGGSPSTRSSPTSPTPQPSGPVVVSLRLSPPDKVELLPQQQTLVLAEAMFADGSRQLVNAVWTSSNQSVVTISTRIQTEAILTGQSAGQAEVLATYQGQSARLLVMVTSLPAYDVFQCPSSSGGGTGVPGEFYMEWAPIFYVLSTAETGRIILRVVDQEGKALQPDSSVTRPVTRGSGTIESMSVRIGWPPAVGVTQVTFSVGLYPGNAQTAPTGLLCSEFVNAVR